MPRPFLTAEWRDLVLANYAIDPDRLLKLVPTGVDLDLHDGKCFVSLVAFKFVNTRVRGIRIPGHSDFVEVNLRFYVRRDQKRGVVFIKEIVPKPAIAWVARTLYGEPYEVWNCSVQGTDYRWNRGSSQSRLAVEVSGEGALPAPDSHEEFITEHYWGYTRRAESRTDEYQVLHPQWPHYAVDHAQIEVDFGAVYGQEWAFLNDAEPYSLLFARGSEIEVFPGNRLSI